MIIIILCNYTVSNQSHLDFISIVYRWTTFHLCPNTIKHVPGQLFNKEIKTIDKLTCRLISKNESFYLTNACEISCFKNELFSTNIVVGGGCKFAGR